MIEIRSGSLQERVLKVLLKQYPITIDELRRRLGVSESIIDRVLKSFQTRGIVSFDKLPDKTFIRLLRRDFMFVGRRATQRKALKRSGQPVKARTTKQETRREDDDMMYG